MLGPQWSATMMATSWGEMTHENEDDTNRRRYSTQREKLLMVLDPAVPDACSFPQMDYASQ